MRKQITLFIAITLILLYFPISAAIGTYGHISDGYKIKTIVIDAGHGGKDTGCKGKHSNEKDIALAISLKLGYYVEKFFPDVKVVYTRKTDVFVELKERANIANRNKADLFISIHCNASASSKSVYGTETYVMGVDVSSANLAVAKRENSVVLMEENYQGKYDGFDPESTETHIRLNLFQNAYLDQSITFASLVENQFSTRANRSSRGVKQAGFWVLYKTTMPSVLVETGFLTNSKEEKYLKTEDGQDYIASAIYRAFKEYKGMMEVTNE